MEHQFLEVAPIIVIALGAAMVFGWIFRKYKQPAVLAELTVGAILGPSLLGILDPEHDAVVQTLAYFGLIVLMFGVGLEVKLNDFIKILRPSLLVAIIGVALPFLSGLGVFLVFGNGMMAALVVGATLTATSTGITIAVLRDLNRHTSQEAKIILGAAVIDDIIGLILLSVIKQIGTDDTFAIWSLVKIVGYATLFLASGILGGMLFGEQLKKNKKIRKWFAGFARNNKVFFLSVFLFCIALSLLAGKMGLAAFIGAFIAGLILEHTGESKVVEKKFEDLTSLFAPLFFVSAGALFDLAVFARFDLYPVVGALAAVAIVGKLLCGMGAVRQKVRKFIIGIGMVPRGEVGLIFASFGLSAGLIAKDMYSALLLVIIITTFLGPLLLGIFFRDKNGSESPAVATDAKAETAEKENTS